MVVASSILWGMQLLLFWQPFIFPFLEVELILWVELQKQYVKTQSHTFFLVHILVNFKAVMQQ